MTVARRLTALLLSLLAAASLSAGAAQAASVGMSDGRPGLFDSEHLRDLNFQQVRLVLPWDAAWRAGDWDTWLARASAQGWPVLVSPTAAGATPSAATYEAALTALLDRYPAIDSVEGWNEPNHAGQPTAGNPALAAAYFEAARRACAARCTAVAGNLLDASSMGTYLASYRKALTTTPAVWGVHNYYDSTYFQSAGVDQMLALGGEVWLTETGGLVSFQPNGPGTGLLPDEHRAADSLRWLFALTAARPRVTRMYLYGMWQQPWNAFDSALIRVDNTEREGMAVVRAYLGARAKPPTGVTAPDAAANGTLVVGTGEAAKGPGAAGPSDPAIAATYGTSPTGNAAAIADGAAKGAPAAAGTNAVFRLIGNRLTVRSATRRASVKVRCALADCRGRLTVKVGSWRYARNLTLRAGATRTIRVRLSRRVAAKVKRRTSKRAQVTLCAGANCSSLPVIRR